MRPPTKPLLIIAKHSSNVTYAFIANPTSTFNELFLNRRRSKQGYNTTIGMFKDIGYDFGPLKDIIPLWVLNLFQNTDFNACYVSDIIKIPLDAKVNKKST